MKVLLTAINAKYIHSNLAIRYLREFVSDLEIETAIKEFSINDREEKIMDEIIKECPDLVGFSTYIWNIEIVKRVSAMIKSLKPEIEIFYGGPEVSYDSVNILKDLAGDYIIFGEGEETFREFLHYKEGKKSLDEIRGLCYKKYNSVTVTGSRPLMDMNKIKFPYKTDEDLNNKIVYYEGSRGCPFNCKYCLSSTVHGVRFLDIERVKNELKYFIDRKVKLVKFVDRTFNCNHKFAIAIWEFLIEQETDTQFHFEISADILKPQEIEVLKKAPKGRFQFEVGVQTTNDLVLNNINRYVNFAHIKEKVTELMGIKNIKQHLDLIAGLPGEDYNSFKKSFNDVYSIKPEEIQLGFLKLLKGSSMREEADKWGMKFNPFPPYEIFETKDITYEQISILKNVEEMVDKYYNSQKFNNIIKFFENKYNNPFDFYYDLSCYFKMKGYFNKNIGNADYYRVFLDFNMEILNGENTYLKDIVKYDYLIFNKRRGMPQFLEENLDKTIQNNMKDALRENYSFKENYIEKFNININKYTEQNIIEEGQYYYLLGYNGGIKDITEEVLNISNLEQSEE